MGGWLSEGLDFRYLLRLSIRLMAIKPEQQEGLSHSIAAPYAVFPEHQNAPGVGKWAQSRRLCPRRGINSPPHSLAHSFTLQLPQEGGRERQSWDRVHRAGAAAQEGRGPAAGPLASRHLWMVSPQPGIPDSPGPLRAPEMERPLRCHDPEGGAEVTQGNGTGLCPPLPTWHPCLALPPLGHRPRCPGGRTSPC